MEIFGWSIWTLGIILLIYQLSIALTILPIIANRAKFFSGLIFIGLVVTFFVNISKLNLLWYFPLSFIISQLLFRTSWSKITTSLNNGNTHDISWPSIVGHVFRVLEFDRAGTTMDSNGRITPKDDFSPYGYLLVESPTYQIPFKLPIVHKDDFFLATTFFDDPKIIKQFRDMDLLVTYIPEHKTADGRIGISHALHYNVTLKGVLERYYNNESHLSNPEPGKIFGQFIYHGEIKIGTNFNPSLY